MAEVGADLAWLAAQGARAVALTAQALIPAARVDTSGVGEQPLLGVQSIAVAAAGVHPARRTRRRAARDELPDGPARLKAGTKRRKKDVSPWRRTRTGPSRARNRGQRPTTTGGYLTVRRDGRWHDSRQAIDSVQTLEDAHLPSRRGGRDASWIPPSGSGPPRAPASPAWSLALELDFGRETYLGPQLEDARPGTPYYVDDARKLCLNFETPLRRAVVPSPFLLSESTGERLIGLPGLFLEDDSGGGLAFLNRGTPGYHLDRQAGVLRNVLAWAPREWLYASDDSLTQGRSRYLALRGRHAYEHAVAPCSSRLEALRAGLDYQLPCLAMAVEASAGPLPPVGSFLAVEPEGIVLTALFGRMGASTPVCGTLRPRNSGRACAAAARPCACSRLLSTCGMRARPPKPSACAPGASRRCGSKGWAEGNRSCRPLGLPPSPSRAGLKPCSYV